MHTRAFLKVVGQLRVGTRHDARRDRQSEREIGDQQRPDRAVDRNRARQEGEGPQEADAHDHTGHHPRQPRETFDYFAAMPACADRDIGDDGAERHGRGCSNEAQQQCIENRAPQLAVLPDILVVLERQHVELVEAHELEERAKCELPDRQDRRHEEEQREEGECRPFPLAELDEARLKALAGDGLVALAAQNVPLHDNEEEHQPHHREGK